MTRLKDNLKFTLSALWTCVFAVLLTALASLVWGALFSANLQFAPEIPWSAAIMALVLLAIWMLLDGRWGRRARQARRDLLRAKRMALPVFARAVLAGGCSLIALSGLWIVLFQVLNMPGNRSDFSRLPALTYFSALAVAALSGAITEEAGFRGYFQNTLERRLSPAFAIIVSALAMIPEHASTQGFVLPTILFYLAVDVMLGSMAYLTQSILPGIVIHAVGLMIFFAIIWPGDRLRESIWINGPDLWFWIHVAQAALFGTLALAAFGALAKNRAESRFDVLAGRAAANPVPA